MPRRISLLIVLAILLAPVWGVFGSAPLAIAQEDATVEASQEITPETTQVVDPAGENTATPTNTPEPTATETTEPTATETAKPTSTATSVPTSTSTSVPTNTATTVPTKTATPKPTKTATPKPTKTATPRPTSTPRPIGSIGNLSVTLNCRGYGESIRVVNSGPGWVKVRAITTLFDVTSKEPFGLSKWIRPGGVALFTAGAGADSGTILTKGYIFTNSAYEKDGVRITTDVGRITKNCPVKPAPPERFVEVDLSSQYLWAWEGNRIVNQTYVSTGKPGFETPTGTYYILVKYLTDDMEGTIGGEYYNVPDVPWTMYFTNYGHALHGAYWHDQFGTPRSHGCINLPTYASGRFSYDWAQWLYYWLPYGGRVVIHW